MIKTSESVLLGHPDKVCDIIADYILEEIVLQDINAKVAIECLIKSDLLLIAGEVTTTTKVDYEQIATRTLKEIGYAEEFDILVEVSEQSPNIAQGVDTGGAGDQGIMYGYAINETEELMPLPIVLARDLADGLNTLSTLYPEVFGVDGKCQVSVEYDKDNQPIAVNTIVVSLQTKPKVERDRCEELIQRAITLKIPKELINSNTNILINPTGEFTIGGPYADSGLTGRKLQCDSYGGLALHGGGAWSGKDLSKVDRSAAYFARYLAKNLVAAKVVDECTVGIAYAIGVAEPVAITVTTNKPQLDEKILKKLKETFDFKPKSIINRFKNYKSFGQLAKYGHVGAHTRIILYVPWEELNLVKDLKELITDG